MIEKMPAWAELLILNFQDRMGDVFTETEVSQAFDLALEDTARDIAGRAGNNDGEVLARILLECRRRPPTSFFRIGS